LVVVAIALTNACFDREAGSRENPAVNADSTAERTAAAETAQPPPPGPPPDTGPPSAPIHPPEAPLSRDSDVVAAVRFAYGLEASLYASVSNFSTWDDVYQHIKRGWVDSLARNLADYYWWSEGSALRMTESVLQVPGQVFVLQHDTGFASVWFNTPPILLEGSPPYTRVRLGREDDRWVVTEAEGLQDIPVTP
jgi:hypothetical protein